MTKLTKHILDSEVGRFSTGYDKYLGQTRQAVYVYVACLLEGTIYFKQENVT